eukprot:g17908.t2
MKSAIVHGKAAGSDKGSGVDLVILILAIFVFATILFVGAQAPATHYDCSAGSSDPDPSWDEKHIRWCCYKYRMYCPQRVVDKNIYHTVTKIQHVKVPVPEPMPTHAPIIHTIQHSYHVPSPPTYVKVNVPGPKIVKPVVVKDNVPYPVKEPPQIINVKKPYPVHIKGDDHYVKVPVPSPPHYVTHYHTQWHTVVDPFYDCHNGLDSWHSLWSHSKQHWCCQHSHLGCQPVGHWEKVVHVIHTYDCHAGFSNWYHGWSDPKKSWCCANKHMGCPGTWHGHWHAHAVVHVAKVHGVGKGGYDCNAGASNWMQGWSSKKKDWCCSNGHSQYCVKFHCHEDTANQASWASDKRDFCCQNFQLGCPHTTLSPLGCDAQCELNGESSTCQERIDWTQKHVFGEKSNGCNLAYSRIQVECDVCRACTIQAAGCGEQGPGKAAFDCQAALGNWCRAWSPAKKVWCCKEKGKGCQSVSAPPACDAGEGKVWKKVFINGHWSWEAHMAHGAVSVQKPYDCHAGLAGWAHGWSEPKKTWCCGHEKLGCPGYVYHGAGAVFPIAGHAKFMLHAAGRDGRNVQQLLFCAICAGIGRMAPVIVGGGQYVTVGGGGGGGGGAGAGGVAGGGLGSYLFGSLAQLDFVKRETPFGAPPEDIDSLAQTDLGLFYQRYQEGSTEAITYAGPGQGHIESRLVEVNPGQGSYAKYEQPTYAYRPRWGLISMCTFFVILLIFAPFLFICEVRTFFFFCVSTGLRKTSLAPRATHAIWRTARFRLSVMCAAHAPSRLPAAASKDLAKLPSTAMLLWAIGAARGLPPRRSGAVRRRAKAASLRIHHPTVMLVLVRYGRKS